MGQGARRVRAFSSLTRGCQEEISSGHDLVMIEHLPGSECCHIMGDREESGGFGRPLYLRPSGSHKKPPRTLSICNTDEAVSLEKALLTHGQMPTLQDKGMTSLNHERCPRFHPSIVHIWTKFYLASPPPYALRTLSLRVLSGS